MRLGTAVRHGRERGSVPLGGRRVPVTRPRVRAADGEGELSIASYELFTSTEILGKMAMENMLAGLSTRRYPVGLEPVGEQVAEQSSATSKSAVSRRFVAMTETALAELLAADLSGLDLVAVMIDGVHFAESCCVVALSIGIDGSLDRVDDLGLPQHAGNVKRWRDGQMALRWCAAGMVEAGKQFRRVNGHHLHLPTLRAALERESAESGQYLYWNLSVWNQYQVMEMRTDLTKV